MLQVEGWHERAPQSWREEDAAAPTASEARLTATAKPPGTRLNEIFISVKTTSNYHKWRLPVILKTWFQLAKQQVLCVSYLFYSLENISFLFIILALKKENINELVGFLGLIV